MIWVATCKPVKLGQSTVALSMELSSWWMQQTSKDSRSQRRNSIVCWRCLSSRTYLSSSSVIRSIRMAAWRRRSWGKCWDYITTQPMARTWIRRMLVRDLSRFLCAQWWREWATPMDSSGWVLSLSEKMPRMQKILIILLYIVSNKNSVQSYISSLWFS